ncbi:STAS domain-containing protein [Robertmurraya yapensis]|uniref:STAS domain-containing protein n=1 Tax=Bacillus yapensis TaxID=2492960 RepID=A0A3S0I6C0_9BACI|nr:RsbT co-antagonist protein RsbRA [Bacillus yapensis]RTR28492.1 STAS domain-containing protein [Bacillus yapensis]TKS94553.1 STAS domain-containing protein [Bacillus yapensis]
MNSLIINYIDNHKEHILNLWVEKMKEKADDRVLRVVSNQVFVGTSREFVEMVTSNLNDENEEYSERLRDFAEKVVKLGWPISFVTEGIQVFSTIVYDGIKDEKLINEEDEMKLFYGLHKWTNPMTNEIVNVYSTTWERTVSLQKIALQELSAPLIPVFDGISVMPLIGAIDTERAKQIMENLLNGVVKHRSEVVLIDITGVPVVDTMVAHHIIQAADAVRLVGAQCMLVGIRPEIAQTIVSLGINLNQVTTKNTLKKGMEAALEIMKKKMIQVGEISEDSNSKII